MAVRDVIARIKAINDTKKGARAAERTLGSFAKRASGLVKGLIGPVAVLGGAAGFGLITKSLISAGSAALETRSKFETVFAETTPLVQEFNKEFGRLAGVSQVNLEALTSTTAAIAQGLGFATEASANLAIEVTKLSGDIGSFNNLPTEDVARRIQSALTGETESLKTLGIVLRQTDIQQQAMINTGKKSATQLTNQEKATAALQLITKRAGAAVGDLERTQDSFANQTRRLRSGLTDLRDTIGKGVIPVLVELLPLLQNAIDRAIDLAPKLVEVIGQLSDAVGITTKLGREAAATVKTLDDAALDDEIRDVNMAIRDQLDLIAESEARGGIRKLFGKPFEARELREELGAMEDKQKVLTNEAERRLTAERGTLATLENQNAAAAEAARLAQQARIEAEAARVLEGLQPRLREGEFGVQAPGLRGLEGVTPPPIPQPVIGSINEFNQAFQEAIGPVTEFFDSVQSLDDTLGRLAGETLVNLSSAFNDAFAAIGAGEPVFGSIAKAVKNSVAETAAAEGRLEFARGAAKIAAGIFPPNPLAITSGLKHFAAGALFSAIGGALGGGGGRGAGGGGGRGRGNNALRETTDPFSARQNITVNLQGSNFLDFNDPSQRAAFAGMFRELGADNVIITEG